MEQEFFAKLLDYGDPAKAKTWGEIEQYMRQFNATVADEDRHKEQMENKIKVLNRAFADLNINDELVWNADPREDNRGASPKGYREADARDARTNNLQGLNPADYPGAILQ